MSTEDLATKAPVSLTIGPIPTGAILVLAAYGAGTAGTQVAVVLSSMLRKRKAKKATPETTPETPTA